MRETMKAGRELDALIAERVMGISVFEAVPYEGYNGPDWVEEHTGREMARYSTDIAAAWTVVEKMRAADWWFALTQDNTDIWDAKFWRGEPDGWFPRVEAHAHEQHAPHSICLAALNAVRSVHPDTDREGA